MTGVPRPDRNDVVFKLDIILITYVNHVLLQRKLLVLTLELSKTCTLRASPTWQRFKITRTSREEVNNHTRGL